MKKPSSTLFTKPFDSSSSNIFSKDAKIGSGEKFSTFNKTGAELVKPASKAFTP